MIFVQAVNHGIAGKWFSTGHDFVEDAPERKNVRPLIDGAAQRLFGRHVTDGPHHRAGLARFRIAVATSSESCSVFAGGGSTNFASPKSRIFA